MTALTRGPLPAGVYWRRRLLLALVLLGLVVGTVRLLTLGSDDSADAPRATQAAAEPTAGTEPTVAASDTPSESRVPAEPAAEEPERRPDRDRPVLAEPEGDCTDRDVAVTPSVRRAVAGSPVTFTLELRTITTPACTWQVSPSTLTMKLTSGSDDIWSSQDCPRAVPTEDVIVRNTTSTEVEVTWSGRRSDDECSRLTEWALPGWYYVDAAALAGEPSDLHFELEEPEPGVVTRTVRPKQERDGDRDRDRSRDRPRDRDRPRG